MLVPKRNFVRAALRRLVCLCPLVVAMLIEPRSIGIDADVEAGADGNLVDLSKYPSSLLQNDAPTYDRYGISRGSFEVDIRGRKVKVVYAYPQEGQKISPTASDIIFYGPYPDENTKLDSNIVPDLVSRLGCLVYSFSFVADRADLSNPSTAYWSKDSGWLEAILSTKQRLMSMFGLIDKPLILMGYSAGGGLVNNFAVNFPTQVEAVATQGANTNPSLSIDRFGERSPKWLILNNRGDTNSEINFPFYRKLKSYHVPALYCETTPDRARGHYHAPGDQTFALIYTFIYGVVNERRSHPDGKVESWPYACSIDPFQRFRIVRTVVLNDEDCDTGRLDFLPCSSFALLWSKVCPPIQRVAVEGNLLHLSYPALQTPKGVILYYDGLEVANVPRFVEDVSSLAEHGYLVISPCGSEQPQPFASAAVEWLKAQDKLQGLRKHVVGFNPKGAAFLNLFLQEEAVAPASMNLILFRQDLSQEEIPQLRTLAQSVGMFGFYSVARASKASELQAMVGDLLTKPAIERGCYGRFITDPDFNDTTSLYLDDARLAVQSKNEEEAIDYVKALIDKSNN